MTRITVHSAEDIKNAWLMEVPPVPYYSGHSKFLGYTWTLYTEIFIEYGKIWLIPQGGKIELEWTDDLSSLGSEITMELIGEAYE